MCVKCSPETSCKDLWRLERKRPRLQSPRKFRRLSDVRPKSAHCKRDACAPVAKYVAQFGRELSQRVLPVYYLVCLRHFFRQAPGRAKQFLARLALSTLLPDLIGGDKETT